MPAKNVGTIDAYVRLTLGLAALTWATTGKLGKWTGWVTLLGAMKVAEGVTRYSPLLAALGTSTLESVVDMKGQPSFDEFRSKSPLPSPFNKQ